MEMSARKRSFCGSISSTVPVKSKNGPEVTFTRSPFLKSILSLGVSMPICLRIVLTSFSASGSGFSPEPGDPTKPVTPCVLRTTYHDWSVIFISTST